MLHQLGPAPSHPDATCAALTPRPFWRVGCNGWRGRGARKERQHEADADSSCEVIREERAAERMHAGPEPHGRGCPRTGRTCRWQTASAQPDLTAIFLQCQRRDSNPDTVRYQILSLACLPIPPRRRTAWKLQCRGSHADCETAPPALQVAPSSRFVCSCAGDYLPPTRTVSIRLVCDCTL